MRNVVNVVGVESEMVLQNKQAFLYVELKLAHG